MKSFIRIISIIYLIQSAVSCKSYPIEVSQKNDVDRNSEELKKTSYRTQKTEVNYLNNFGKPIIKPLREIL